ncbi:MAG: hypothetical protein LQ351_001351 [Letrouitia transgressa]|nr:MAG: hypothetical protein LQ351_001351 [Letrouitia transgressa]
MPLHLLGKKSWNVYNSDNIARVKRDEAAAAAREAAEEQRMQDVDAERRMNALRGVDPGPVPALSEPNEPISEKRERDQRQDRKRRRRAGEDDTERDIRFAKENQNLAPSINEVQLTTRGSSDAPLMDQQGHINLFPLEGPKRDVLKNVEAEAEKAKKKREAEDQYTMRFSNAAGFKQSINQSPWYHSTSAGESKEDEMPTKDMWGNEDPRRKERERMRISAEDPMVAMRKGVAQLREYEKEKARWREEQMNEMLEIKRMAKRDRKRKKRNEDDEESLERFSLDDPPKERKHRHHSHRDEDGVPRHRHKSRHEKDKGRPKRHHTHPRKSHNPEALTRPGWEVGAGGRYSSQFAQVIS